VAAQNGNVELVKLLLKAGAKTNLRETGTKDQPGQLPLQLATKNGHEEVVEELLKASGKTSGSRTKPPAGLHEAASTGNKRLVARFLQNGASLEQLSTEEECTPLMLAAFNAYPEVVRQLLDAGANVDTANGHGQTALTIAVHGAWVRSDWGWRERRFDEALQTLKLLIDRGANLNAKTHEGETALEMAKVSRLKTIAALLRKAGAE
jgi:ankyrin repeat protein